MAKDKSLELLERLLNDWQHCAWDDEYGGLSPDRKRDLKRYRKALDQLQSKLTGIKAVKP